MSRLTYQTRDIAVYDDVLSPDDFTSLFRYLNSVEYRSVHDRGWRKVWRLHDGNPLTSSAGWYYGTDQPRPPGESSFPTGTPVDPVVAWISDRFPEVKSIVGSPAVEWDRFSFAPWVYPPGSGLSLHADGHKYTGAFTFFCHKEWRLHWGGHLMVLDPQTTNGFVSTGELSPPFLDDQEETARAFSPGVAVTVLAKPNRIAFLSPKAQHLLTRVDVNAGQTVRMSVAGFFHKPEMR
jgi:hypothetical protein